MPDVPEPIQRELLKYRVKWPTIPTKLTAVEDLEAARRLLSICREIRDRLEEEPEPTRFPMVDGFLPELRTLAQKLGWLRGPLQALEFRRGETVEAGYDTNGTTVPPLGWQTIEHHEPDTWAVLGYRFHDPADAEGDQDIITSIWAMDDAGRQHYPLERVDKATIREMAAARMTRWVRVLTDLVAGAEAAASDYAIIWDGGRPPAPKRTLPPSNGSSDAMEVDYDESHPGFITATEAVKLTDGRLKLPDITKILNRAGNKIHYMRKGQRCRLSLDDFRRDVLPKTKKADGFDALDDYVGDVADNVEAAKRGVFFPDHRK